MAMAVKTEVVFEDAAGNINRLTKENEGIFIHQGDDTVYVPNENVAQFLKVVKDFAASK